MPGIIPLSAKSSKKRPPAAGPSGNRALRLFRQLQRILQRWRECWRLAALPAPEVRKASVLPPAVSHTSDGDYMPNAGMRGKHVEWVPCSPVVIDKMLDMAKVTPDDYVIDPGSGDGRIVIRVAKLGARALGIEANPRLVALSQHSAQEEGVGDTAAFLTGDFFEADLSKATVVTLFLRRDLNLRLRAGLLNLKPGTRIVSNIFDMGDWEPDEVAGVEDGDYYFRNHTVYLWIVPARVEGRWEFPEGELAIHQKFQRIGGTLTAGGNAVPIEGSVTGDRIDFSDGSRQYTGRMTGGRMTLEAMDGGKVNRGASERAAPAKGEWQAIIRPDSAP